MKYDFYNVEPTIANKVKQVAKTAGASSDMSDDSTIQLEQSDDDDKSSKLSKRFGPEFIITFCCVLILLYIIFSVIAHLAYREWKGIAEDCAGGSINTFDGNILHYAVIAKREDDAIEEKKELEEKRKKWLEKNGKAGGDEEEKQPLNGDEEDKKDNEDVV